MGLCRKPELQKLNRNSIYVFVNGRLIRDKVILHAFNEAYRNIIPPTSFPVVLLFLEMPPQEVDVNVHPAKTEVRFRQGSFVHDFVRDSVRTALMNARPAAEFLFGALQWRGAGERVVDGGCESAAGRGWRRCLNRAWLMVEESEGAIEPGDVASVRVAGSGWCRLRRGDWGSAGRGWRWGMRRLRRH